MEYFLIYCLFCAAYSIRHYIRHMPEIEEELIEENEYANALGCVPMPLKVIAAMLIILTSPITTPFLLWGEIRG